jgi:heme o synthase
MSLIKTAVLRSRAQAAARTSPLSSDASKRISLYLELTKPGISLFVAMSAVAGYVVTAGAELSWLRAMLVVAATMLMSAGAAAQNQIVEAERDRSMRRTASRPMPARLIESHDASAFAWTLTLTGFTLALATLPLLAAVFLSLCHISYVNWYTPLKARTPLCTLVGALPGALPVLAGAAASVHGIGLPALLLTGLLFTWQLPHFMAIGWLAREDYARGNFAMLFLSEPSGRQSAVVALLYALAMGCCAALLALALSTSVMFVAIALGSSAAYTALAAAFLRERSRTHARRLFFSSIIILPLLLITLSYELIVLR